jgi:hypothetical protein
MLINDVRVQEQKVVEERRKLQEQEQRKADNDAHDNSIGMWGYFVYLVTDKGWDFHERSREATYPVFFRGFIQDPGSSRAPAS